MDLILLFLNYVLKVTVFGLLFLKKAGKIKDLNYPPLQSQYNIEWYVNKGDLLEDTTMIGERAATMFAYNSNYTDLYNDFHNISNLEFLDFE